MKIKQLFQVSGIVLWAYSKHRNIYLRTSESQGEKQLCGTYRNHSHSTCHLPKLSIMEAPCSVAVAKNIGLPLPQLSVCDDSISPREVGALYFSTLLHPSELKASFIHIAHSYRSEILLQAWKLRLLRC